MQLTKDRRDASEREIPMGWFARYIQALVFWFGRHVLITQHNSDETTDGDSSHISTSPVAKERFPNTPVSSINPIVNPPEGTPTAAQDPIPEKISGEIDVSTTTTDSFVAMTPAESTSEVSVELQGNPQPETLPIEVPIATIDIGKNFSPEGSDHIQMTSDESPAVATKTAEIALLNQSNEPDISNKIDSNSGEKLEHITTTTEESTSVAEANNPESPHPDPVVVTQSQNATVQDVAGSIGAPLKYRPRLRPRSTTAADQKAKPQNGDQATASLEAQLLITFLPVGWGISMSVVLGRADGLPETIDVRLGDEQFSLLPIDDKMFEPLHLSTSADLISSAVVAESAEPIKRRWVRSPRDLHVFSQRSGLSGFVSLPRVLIGQENIVLCRSRLSPQVKNCCWATGSDELIEVTGPGIPDGWQCFRGLRPKRQAIFENSEEIFLALNPHADAAIEFSGGIALARNAWMVNKPPIIRVLGAEPLADELTIDGTGATKSEDDSWIAPEWDKVGRHVVQYGGLSRSYEIVEIDESWPSWRTSESSEYFACGALVTGLAHRQAYALRGESRWLIGASPGDVALAIQTAAGVALAAPTFLPVWALPISRGGRLAPPQAMPYRSEPRISAQSGSMEKILQWSGLIRAAGSPRDAEEKKLWREYRRIASNLRRRVR